MASSLPASLFLLSVVFCQFVSAAGQNIMSIKAEPGDNLFLPCESSDQGEIRIAEWRRTDLGPESVLMCKDFHLDTENQHPSYTDRVDLLIGQIKKGDASLILKNTKTDDSGTYECHVLQTGLEKKLISSVSLDVAPPEPFPDWEVLLVLLVLALVVAASLALFSWLRWKPVPVQVVEVESGEKSVLLPFKVPRCLWFFKYRIFLHVDKVEWTKTGRMVHECQNGSDQPGEQNLISTTRIKMDKNLLKTGDLSLTLSWPTGEDKDIYICRVYSRKGDVLMMKVVWLQVKVQQVKVESGEESVLLRWRIRKNLGGVDGDNRKVHV